MTITSFVNHLFQADGVIISIQLQVDKPRRLRNCELTKARPRARTLKQNTASDP